MVIAIKKLLVWQQVNLCKKKLFGVNMADVSCNPIGERVSLKGIKMNFNALKFIFMPFNDMSVHQSSPPVQSTSPVQ